MCKKEYSAFSISVIDYRVRLREIEYNRSILEHVWFGYHVMQGWSLTTIILWIAVVERFGRAS